MCAYSVFNTFPVYPLSAKPLILLAFCRYRYHTSLLSVPVGKKTRNACACLLGNDIGEYNTCGHFCKYCYANVDRAIVKKNMAAHDSNSPLLVGKIHAEDEVRDVVQKSWLPKQLRLPL